MNKVLEALGIYLDKRIKDIKNYLEFNERSENEKGFTPSEELQICYLAKRMLAIDNANPSEALEDLDRMAHQVFQVDDDFELYYDKVKQHLLKAQEQEKVLKIIFEKYVDLNLIDCNDEVEGYNRHFGKDRQLTQEEFELLREALKP